MSTSTDLIVPVGNGTCPLAAIVAALNVYVAVPSAFMTGVTLLQPRKKGDCVVVYTSNRGEPPLHWAALARVNDAEVNVDPSNPVMSAPAAAFVAVGQFLARCRTPLL